jgi:hypothetical protein
VFVSKHCQNSDAVTTNLGVITDENMKKIQV